VLRYRDKVVGVFVRFRAPSAACLALKSLLILLALTFPAVVNLFRYQSRFFYLLQLLLCSRLLFIILSKFNLPGNILTKPAADDSFKVPRNVWFCFSWL
jgi:hypothetical protein